MTINEITHGFGVPDTPLPHQFLIRIPGNHSGDVEVWEDFGAAGVDTSAQKVCRAALPLVAWQRISADLRRYLNRRLAEKNIKGSCFSIGENKVERILGRELCVLIWAIDEATPDETDMAFARWSSHRPEELWWLFQQIDRDGGKWDSPRSGWRTAVRHALIRDWGEVHGSAYPLQLSTDPPMRDLFSEIEG